MGRKRTQLIFEHNAHLAHHCKCLTCGTEDQGEFTDYLFCSTIDDREVFVVGYLDKHDFLRYSTFRRQGEPDEEGPAGAGWTFRADCYNIPYAALRPIGSMPLEA